MSVFSVHPGFVGTNLFRYFGSDSFLMRHGVSAMVSFLSKTSVQGAQTTIHCAVADVEAESGKYFR